jgi:hypothetical protein
VGIAHPTNMNTLERFLIQASGGERSILEKPECATERGKYAMIGATVIFNGVLAYISGGYALFTIFRSLPVALSLGAFYGAIILNIDRFLVATTYKKEKPSWSDYTNLGIGLGLAISMSFVVVKPLEIKIFEQPILTRLHQENLRVAEEMQSQLDVKYSELDDLRKQRQTIVNQVNQKQQRRDQAFAEAMAENDGTKGTLKAGRGPVFAEKFRESQKLDQDYSKFAEQSETTLQQLDQRIAVLTQKRDEELEFFVTRQRQDEGLITQLYIHHVLTQENPTLNVASWAITILFIVLDTVPMLAKALMKRSIYDAILEGLETKGFHQQKYQSKMEVAQETFKYQQYEEALKVAFSHPKQAQILEEIAEKIVENSRHQLMSYVNQYRYPDAELYRQVKEAYHQEIKDLIQEEVKRRIVETRANNSFESILQEIRLEMNNLTENNHHF